MGLTNFPHGVSSFGIPQIGAGAFPFTTTGSVFFVHNGTGVNSPGRGTSPDTPLASLDYAVGRCAASKGDVIYAMPGHVETVSAAGGLDLDIAGISIIGLGSGSLRPVVNFTTATTADMDVDAANVTIINVVFAAGVDALVAPIDINAADCSLFNIETRDTTGSYQTVDWIVTDANANRLKIDGWVHRGATDAGADSAISIVGGDGIWIDNFDIDGNLAVAAIETVTTDSTNLKIGCHSTANYIRTRNANDIAITATSATTGAVNNILIRLADDATNVTECIVGADMNYGLNIAVFNADGERAQAWDGTATSG